MGKNLIGQNKSRLFRSRRHLCAVFAAAALLPGCAATAQQKNNAPQGNAVAPAAHVINHKHHHNNTSSKITADLASKKNTIPAGFVGFSDELKDVISSEDSHSPIFSPSNKSLIGLLKLLGPNGYARFGGESQDRYTPGEPKPLVAPPLTKPIARDLAGFMAALGHGWTLNYGLDGQINDRAEAVKQAGYIKTAVRGAGGGNPVNFSIGNEPNQWSQALSSVSGCSTGECEWRHVFNSYYPALKAAYPSIKIDAPEYAGFPSAGLFNYINGTNAGSSSLAGISPHWYPVSKGTVNVAHALSAAGSVKWSGWQDINKMRITESGITAGGGGAKEGTSNDIKYTTSLVSATWYLEMAIEAATNKWAGVGQHMVLTAASGQLNGYNRPSYSDCVKQSGPVDPVTHDPTGSNWSPAPCFYGWYLMSMMEGQPVVANTTSGVASPANVAEGVYVLTTKNKSGNANILIVNGNKHATYDITPGQSKPWSTAKVYQLDGTSCTDKNPTLNGKPIGNGGSWAGTPETLNHGKELTIPACGAAVVQIQGGGRVHRKDAFNATSAWRTKAGPRAGRGGSHHIVRIAKSHL